MLDTSHRLVVAGASLAGLRAVEAARKQGFRGTITLLGAENQLPYDRPPLSKACLDAEPGDLPDLAYRTRAALVDELDVDLRLGCPAVGLDTEQRVVRTPGGDVPFDALVVATGATARTLDGTSGLPGVHTLRTLYDARAVRAALDAGARTVVVGAGFIGSEVASGARKRGLPVTILESADVPLERALGAEMGLACAALHERNGTDLRRGVTVESVRHNGSELQVDLAGGESLSADLVVVGIGATPETGWLSSSALTVENGVVCDENLWTGVPGVYAAGDVARWHNPLFGEHMRLEHWTSAAEQGARASVNALAPSQAQPYSTVPYFWSDWYGTRIQFVGVPRADEVRVVSGDPDAGKFAALYRRGDRLAGALTVGFPAHTMKYRRLIGESASWAAALDFAAARNARAA